MEKDKDIHDPSAVDEYFKLKQMLCLTEEEHFYLKYRQPYQVLDTDEVIFHLWQYIEKVKPKMYDIANWLQLHRVTLSKILYGHKKPSLETVTKIVNFLRSEGRQI